MALGYNNKIIRDRIEKVTNIKKVNIATAFISMEGVRILKKVAQNNGLINKEIDIYLSVQFAQKERKKILIELMEFTNVYLIEDLHAKVYWFKGDKDLLIYGSANFTQKAMERNIEFYDIQENVSNLDKETLSGFFDIKLRSRRIQIMDTIISSYARLDTIDVPEKNEKTDLIKTILSEITGKVKKTDESIYDGIENFYFIREDYEVFEACYNKNSTDPYLDGRRKYIQKQLLSINDGVKKRISEMGLYNHWNKKFITSLTRPCDYNLNKVDWLGVRFGRFKNKAQCIKSKEDEFLGFQKYACMQFNISLEAVEIGLYHAVPHGAVDRWYLHEILKVENNEVVKKLEKLKGKGLVWREGEEQFELDNRDINEFVEFYERNDREGVQSSIMFRYRPNDERLKTKDLIEKEIIEKFELLYDLYNTVIRKDL